MTFREWLTLQEAQNTGGLMGNPGTPYPDGQTPSSRGAKNKYKLDNSGCSGGPCAKKGGGGMAAAPAGMKKK